VAAVLNSYFTVKRDIKNESIWWTHFAFLYSDMSSGYKVLCSDCNAKCPAHSGNIERHIYRATDTPLDYTSCKVASAPWLASTKLNFKIQFHICLSQWQRGLRRRSAAACLLRLWVRILQGGGAWMSVCCERCVLSSRGFCDGLITRPEESYRLWCVVVCDI
jgi:hypothetical protein